MTLQVANLDPTHENIFWLITAGVMLTVFIYGFTTDQTRYMLVSIIGFMAVNGWNSRRH